MKYFNRPVQCEIFRSDYDSQLNVFYGENNFMLFPTKQEAEKYKETTKKPCGWVNVRRLAGWKKDKASYYHYAVIPIVNAFGSGMFGGSFAWASGSGFPWDGPIPIHDRYE
jgi:hypothetical protein